jgi:hypothetical protein
MFQAAGGVFLCVLAEKMTGGAAWMPLLSGFRFSFCKAKTKGLKIGRDADF